MLALNKINYNLFEKLSEKIV